jgi:hypothetical protein
MGAYITLHRNGYKVGFILGIDGGEDEVPYREVYVG